MCVRVCVRACVCFVSVYMYVCAFFFLFNIFFRFMYTCHNSVYLCLLMPISMFSADFPNKL